jgi:hypothetical protein
MKMPVTNDHIVGFAAGVTVTAVAFYWYDQNRDRVDAYLRSQGVGVGQSAGQWSAPPQYGARPTAGAAGQEGGTQAPTLEELMAQKERLEDMIAELMAAQAEASE